VLRPVVTFTVFSLFFAIWHVPVIYQAALMNPTLHHVEHLVFLLTAIMLWWPILSPLEELPRAPYLVRLAYLFTIPIAQMPVFAGITFNPDVVYPLYAMAPRAFGLTRHGRPGARGRDHEGVRPALLRRALRPHLLRVVPGRERPPRHADRHAASRSGRAAT
jgi:hypothetical protein